MVGLIAKKIGMSQQFSEEGNLVPVTLLRIENNIVINKKNIEKDGYNALVLGSEDVKETKVTKPYKGQFKSNVTPKKYLKEFKVDDPDKYEIGQALGLELFDNIDYVDVVGCSKGKGFQGVVKRHHFSGGRKTHGSKFHRQNGSTGQSSFPSRVHKGIKRAGRMGNDRVTAQNLKIFGKDENENLLIVRGCVPGINNGIVYINKAIKKSK